MLSGLAAPGPCGDPERTHRPTSSNKRTATFQPDTGVTLYTGSDPTVDEIISRHEAQKALTDFTRGLLSPLRSERRFSAEIRLGVPESFNEGSGHPGAVPQVFSGPTQ